MVASASFAATRGAQSLLSFLDKIRFFLNHPMISTFIRCIPKIVIPDILLLSFEWSRSSIIFFMGDEPQSYSIKPGSQNLPIFGKRRKCGKSNSCASFFLQAPSDERIPFWLYDIILPMSARSSRWGDEEVPRMALRVLCPKSPHSEE